MTVRCTIGCLACSYFWVLVKITLIKKFWYGNIAVLYMSYDLNFGLEIIIIIIFN